MLSTAPRVRTVRKYTGCVVYHLGERHVITHDIRLFSGHRCIVHLERVRDGRWTQLDTTTYQLLARINQALVAA